jgi:hypothetical protein
MNIDLLILPPIIALLAGIGILVWPRLLNYIVAAYLILFGAIGLLAHLGLLARTTM